MPTDAPLSSLSGEEDYGAVLENVGSLQLLEKLFSGEPCLFENSNKRPLRKFGMIRNSDEQSSFGVP